MKLIIIDSSGLQAFLVTAKVLMKVIADHMFINETFNKYLIFLVSGLGLACQQEISLVLATTLPIHY